MTVNISAVFDHLMVGYQGSISLYKITSGFTPEKVLTRNRPNQEIMLSDWLITSHVT